MSQTPTPKVIVCIFAHPDDEAFGPGGAIAHYSQLCDVHIICVTDGGAGRNSNPSEADDLAKIRRLEFENSTKILGVKSTAFLGFVDGSLNNNNYHQVATRIQSELDKLRPDTILTFDLNGVSGHLDHIAVAMISSYLWERLDYIRNIFYFCEKKIITDKMAGQYFIYFPPGYEQANIDLALDVSPVFNTKLKAMHCHVSQSDDCEHMIKTMGDDLQTEHFRILQKT